MVLECKYHAEAIIQHPSHYLRMTGCLGYIIKKGIPRLYNQKWYELMPRLYNQKWYELMPGLYKQKMCAMLCLA